jgi:hypothetical protein
MLAMCGIHAGEVEGKEGRLMLIRDRCLAPTAICWRT